MEQTFSIISIYDSPRGDQLIELSVEPNQMNCISRICDFHVIIKRRQRAKRDAIERQAPTIKNEDKSK